MSLASTLIRSIFSTSVILIVVVMLGSVAKYASGSYVHDAQSNLLGLVHLPSPDMLPYVAIGILGLFGLNMLFHHSRSES